MQRKGKSKITPEHIRYGRSTDLMVLFGADMPQISRWDNCKATISEPVLERASKATGLTKGQIIDAYDLRRKDIKAKKSEDWIKWQAELRTLVRNEAIA